MPSGKVCVLGAMLMLASALNALAVGDGRLVEPAISDKLRPERLVHSEMSGGEIDRRITDLIYKNYMVVDLQKDWLDKFVNRTDRPAPDKNPHGTYYGIGKVLDAGSLFARYTGDPRVADRAGFILRTLRSARDPDGYVGFWNVEDGNKQNLANFLLHEHEYLVLALVQHYKVTGDPKSLEDAKLMADYIMRMFPADKEGVHHIPFPPVIAGMKEAFVELYRVTGLPKYREFAAGVRFFPHVYYLEPYEAWEQSIEKSRYTNPPHQYIWTSHLLGDLELFKLTGKEDYLKKNLWMKQELLERGRGMLLITGSASKKEEFAYDQDGAGKLQESCVTAYLLRWFDSLMRLEGDMRYGDIMERSIYNALFGAQSPDGRRICYFTPFSGQRRFQSRDTFCCNGNFRRAVAELPDKVYYRTPDGGIALNLFTASEKTFDVNGTGVTIKQETSYPSSGDVQLLFECSAPVSFPFSFRVPRWCEKVSVQVNQEAPVIIDPAKQELGKYVLDRTWKTGDLVQISMPMDWRLVRGRGVQEGRVAVMRGPVLFTLSESRNAEALKKVSATRNTEEFPIVDPKSLGDSVYPFRDSYQQARGLVLDPQSIGEPVTDDSIRPNGQLLTAKAWTNAERSGEQVDIVLTEFVDPDGIEVYFKTSDMDKLSSPRITDDELLSELPRGSAGPETKAAQDDATTKQGALWEIGPPPSE